MIEVKLTRGHVAHIDDEDWPLIARHQWYASSPTKSGLVYAVTSVPGGKLRMHRLITAATPEIDVDHRDGNGLHNWRDNLRSSTRAQNLANGRLRINNSSGFKGVTPPNRWGRYRALIFVDYKQIHLGMFDSAELAARAYDDAARRHFGYFARVNFPRPDEQGCRP